ncbi:MAG TPA: TIGR01777 family oxidoreductase [Verrucomicrobiae bacterium]|nr:TIGR01777 family oxidoreductase [Verrucomicrobiae bacterium]
MKLVMTGATGLIGSVLADRLWNQNHSLVLLSRRPPAEVNVAKKEWFGWQPGVGGLWENSVDGADGIINLAGEPIAANRWTHAQKEKLRRSRIDGTRSLVEAVAKAKIRPKFLINASAVGYYGPRGDGVLNEGSKPGTGFLADLCVEWEEEASKAEALGVRVVLVRTGIVLAKGKGALAKMVPPFKMFVGGPLGSGDQWMSWIHIDDEVGLIQFLLENQNARGPFNATAANPVTMAEFSKALGEVLNRPSWASVPPSVLALMLGEMADMLLTGQRALPEAATKLGYKFKYGKITDALRSLKL